MKLWYLELKKMFFTRHMLFLILIFFLVNGGRIILGSRYDLDAIMRRSEKKAGEFEAYEQALAGEMTAEKAHKVKEGHEAYFAALGTGEYDKENNYYGLIYDLYRYQYDYAKQMQEFTNRAKENAELFDRLGNRFDAEKNRQIAGIYENRFIRNFYDCRDFKFLFSYDFSTLLILLLALAGSFRLFYMEYQNGTQQFLLTSVNGKKYIAFIKLGAYFFFLFVLIVVFSLEDVLLHAVLFRLNGWLNPVYSIPDYQFCIFSGNMLSYYLFLWILRYMAILSISVFFAFVSFLIQHYVIPIFFNIFAVIFTILLSERSSFSFTFAMLLNPIRLMEPDGLARSYNSISLFGRPMPVLYAAFIAQIVLTIVFAALLIGLYRKQICMISGKEPVKRRKVYD